MPFAGIEKRALRKAVQIACILPILLLPLMAAEQDVGTVTLLEGPLRIIRGTGVLRGAEGMKLRRGDIVESSGNGFVQIELGGGAIMAMGPSTHAYFMGSTASGSEVVFLSGWMKHEMKSSSGTYHCASPELAATIRDGTILLHTTGESSSIFVESGSAAIGSVSPSGALEHPTNGKAGQFFTRRAQAAVTTASRPTQGFIDGMPVQFRDTLPPRLARFAGKSVEPARDHEVSYDEIQRWLTMERSWRRGFVERFEPRLRDPEFRRAVDAHMSQHPEWDPILHPEKYQAKTPSEPTENATSQTGR